MGRRVQGLALVVVVILVALTVPHLGGVRVAGRAILVTVPSAPRVGDCQRSDPPASTADIDPGVAGSGSTTVPCELLHDSQVISVTFDPGRFPELVDGRPHFPDSQGCSAAAYPFLAIRPPGTSGDRSTLLGPWGPASIGTFRLQLPSVLQIRTGHDWLACLLNSPQGPVIGSATGVFSGPARSNPVALCRTTDNVLLTPATSCERPHALEILGWRSVAASETGQGALDASCAQLASRMTGMTDPTNGAELQVAAVVIHDGSSGWQLGFPVGPVNNSGQAACTISPVGSRLLVASLTGLGDAPVPWA